MNSKVVPQSLMFPISQIPSFVSVAKVGILEVVKGLVSMILVSFVVKHKFHHNGIVITVFESQVYSVDR